MFDYGSEQESWFRDDSEQDYWINYSDLLAGLLFVFALMLMAALDHYQERVEEVRDLVEVRREIAQTLNERFGDNPQIEVVPATGVVRFRGDLLFDEAKTEIRPEGKRQLRVFADEYLGVLLGVPRFEDALRAIVIEGHANPRGDYEYNLNLSQARALSVMTFLLDNAPKYRSDLQHYVTANGRSFSDTVFHTAAHDSVDYRRSRRIEIRFRLNDQEILQQIMRRLFFEEEE